ncbi:MAG: hypothetical protein AAF761_00390 [Pseudomonadota bacterium]
MTQELNQKTIDIALQRGARQRSLAVHESLARLGRALARAFGQRHGSAHIPAE